MKSAAYRRPLPFLFINMAMTADGKIATANRAVSSFSSRGDHDHLLALRATGVGVLARRVDRSLDVVQHRQQVTQERHVGVAKLIFQFAGRPFAEVVQFGMST